MTNNTSNNNYNYRRDKNTRKNNLQSIQLIINSASSSDRISIHYKIAEILQIIQGDIDIVTASDDARDHIDQVRTREQLKEFDQQNSETETLVVFDNYTDESEMFRIVDYLLRTRDHYIILKRPDDQLHPWINIVAREIRI